MHSQRGLVSVFGNQGPQKTQQFEPSENKVCFLKIGPVGLVNLIAPLRRPAPGGKSATKYFKYLCFALYSCLVHFERGAVGINQEGAPAGHAFVCKCIYRYVYKNLYK